MTTPFALPNPAASGFSNSSHYDRYRPSYSREAVEKLLTNLGVANKKDGRLVDLASGTGKFTELLVDRPEKFEVVAIEPHEGMRESLVGKNLGIKVLDGDAEHMPIEDGWADALIAAQAFHWFATKSTLKEIHRVLRPGAALGVIWNIEDYNAPKAWQSTTKWEQKLNDILFSLEDGHSRFRHMEWKKIFEKQPDSTSLETWNDTFATNVAQFSLPINEDIIKWTVWLTDENIWSRYTTLSQIANLGEGKKEQVGQMVFDALKGDDVERNERGEVALHGVTYLAWTSKISIG